MNLLPADMNWPVKLSISPIPEHVRTARLVAVAVARQCGIVNETLDEIRLAVGEACTRAVSAHQQAQLQDLIHLEFGTDEKNFIATVSDKVTQVNDHKGEPFYLLTSNEDFAEGLAQNAAAVELAVIAQVVQTLTVTPLPAGGTKVTMTFAIPAAAAGPDRA